MRQPNDEMKSVDKRLAFFCVSVSVPKTKTIRYLYLLKVRYKYSV